MTSVKIKPTPDGKTQITCEFITASHKESNDIYSCYIPSFDIFFSAPSKERVSEKSKALVRLYVNHFMNNPSKRLKGFVLQLHRLGFKAENDSVTLMKIVKNEKVKADFKSATFDVPEGYDTSNVETEELEIAE